MSKRYEKSAYLISVNQKHINSRFKIITVFIQFKNQVVKTKQKFLFLSNV